MYVLGLLLSVVHISKKIIGSRQKCFSQFEANEARLCGEWAVFYHSCAQLCYFAQACQVRSDLEAFARYSFAALIYEVHAAVGSVLFRFRSQLQPQQIVLPDSHMHKVSSSSI